MAGITDTFFDSAANEALFKAIETGSLKDLQAAIAAGACVTDLGPEREIALEKAIETYADYQAHPLKVRPGRADKAILDLLITLTPLEFSTTDFDIEDTADHTPTMRILMNCLPKLERETQLKIIEKLTLAGTPSEYLALLSFLLNEKMWDTEDKPEWLPENQTSLLQCFLKKIPIDLLAENYAHLIHLFDDANTFNEIGKSAFTDGPLKKDILCTLQNFMISHGVHIDIKHLIAVDNREALAILLTRTELAPAELTAVIKFASEYATLDTWLTLVQNSAQLRSAFNTLPFDDWLAIHLHGYFETPKPETIRGLCEARRPIPKVNAALHRAMNSIRFNTNHFFYELLHQLTPDQRADWIKDNKASLESKMFAAPVKLSDKIEMTQAWLTLLLCLGEEEPLCVNSWQIETITDRIHHCFLSKQSVSTLPKEMTEQLPRILECIQIEGDNPGDHSAWQKLSLYIAVVTYNFEALKPEVIALCDDHVLRDILKIAIQMQHLEAIDAIAATLFTRPSDGINELFLAMGHAVTCGNPLILKRLLLKTAIAETNWYQITQSANTCDPDGYGFENTTLCTLFELALIKGQLECATVLASQAGFDINHPIAERKGSTTLNLFIQLLDRRMMPLGDVPLYENAILFCLSQGAHCTEAQRNIILENCRGLADTFTPIKLADGSTAYLNTQVGTTQKRLQTIQLIKKACSETEGKKLEPLTDESSRVERLARVFSLGDFNRFRRGAPVRVTAQLAALFLDGAASAESRTADEPVSGAAEAKVEPG